MYPDDIPPSHSGLILHYVALWLAITKMDRKFLRAESRILHCMEEEYYSIYFWIINHMSMVQIASRKLRNWNACLLSCTDNSVKEGQDCTTQWPSLESATLQLTSNKLTLAHIAVNTSWRLCRIVSGRQKSGLQGGDWLRWFVCFQDFIVNDLQVFHSQVHGPNFIILIDRTGAHTWISSVNCRVFDSKVKSSFQHSWTNCCSDSSVHHLCSISS